ncbi:hypothetical protein RBSWK_05734 [Rhodopirellula baltica SWK14]|uniref:Uncharacterized protein n=1 Tax=Rhodopirellula baltica SWK14 TaxID=993516 RepID=L7C8G5_RHOBT|nr:hypothetical protein RBSWK_05734 [Rhodopirellula baltica SWK14]
MNGYLAAFAKVSAKNEKMFFCEFSSVKSHTLASFVFYRSSHGQG